MFSALTYLRTSLTTRQSIGRACPSWQLLLQPGNKAAAHWNLSQLSCPRVCRAPYIHCSALNPASVTMQTHGSEGTENRGISCPTNCIPLQSERALPVSLSGTAESGGGAADRGRNKAEADDAATMSTAPPQTCSLHRDPARSLRMNLTFYLKGETYTGNSCHFSLLLKQDFAVFLKA